MFVAVQLRGLAAPVPPTATESASQLAAREKRTAELEDEIAGLNKRHRTTRWCPAIVNPYLPG